MPYLPWPPQRPHNSADLHQFQEHPLAKVGWTCPPVATPLIRVKFGTGTYGKFFYNKFNLNRCVVSSPRAKTPISLHFQIQHSVVAPPSGAETKLNAGEQQHTYLYAVKSKPSLYSKTLRFKKRDRQKRSNFFLMTCEFMVIDKVHIPFLHFANLFGSVV